MKNNTDRRDLRLTITVLVCMTMAVGPGVFLVNRPVCFLGLPVLYVWAILWYLGLCLVALTMLRKTWSEHAQDEDPGE